MLSGSLRRLVPPRAEDDIISRLLAIIVLTRLAGNGPLCFLP